MAILAMCPDKLCGELFEVPDAAAGQQVRCPACGKVQTIAAQERPRTKPVHGEDLPQPEDLGEPLATGGEEDLPFFEAEDEQLPLAAEETPLPRPAAQEEDELDFGVDEEPPKAPQRGKPARGAADLPPPGEDEESFMPVQTRREVRSLYSHRPKSRAAERIAIPEEPAGDESMLGLFAGEVADEQEQAENKLVVAALVAVGGIGLVAGALAGAGLGGEWPVLGALLGAGCGWVIGVLAAFMLILAHPKDEVPKVRCTTCGNVFPADIESCKWCGAALPGPGVSPLTAGCLASHRYAVSNAKSAVGLAMLVAVPAAMIYAAFNLPQAPKELPPILTALSVVLAFLVGSCWLRYFLTVVSSTLLSAERAPEAPRVWDLHNLAVGIKGIGAAVIYILPLFTVPLLPLAMLRLSSPRQHGAFDPVLNTRAALAHARDFAALWLWKLLWLAVVAFSTAIIILLFNLKELIPTMEGDAKIIVDTLLLGAEVAIIAVAAAVCGTAIFRCIGLFGRQNAKPLLLQDDYRAPAAASPAADGKLGETEL